MMHWNFSNQKTLFLVLAKIDRTAISVWVLVARPSLWQHPPSLTALLKINWTAGFVYHQQFTQEDSWQNQQCTAWVFKNAMDSRFPHLLTNEFPWLLHLHLYLHRIIKRTLLSKITYKWVITVDETGSNISSSRVNNEFSNNSISRFFFYIFFFNRLYL